MCKEMDNIRIEAERVGVLKAILSTMKTQGWDVEKTMSIIGIKEEERPLYAASAKYAMTRQGAKRFNKSDLIVCAEKESG